MRSPIGARRSKPRGDRQFRPRQMSSMKDRLNRSAAKWLARAVRAYARGVSLRRATSLVFGLALLARCALAHADALDDALAAYCTHDARLDGAAREALAHHEALDAEAMRAAAERSGLPAPAVRAWVGRGSDIGALSTLARAWLARQRSVRGWARCALAHHGSLWALVLAPRVAEVSASARPLRTGERVRYAFALPPGTEAPTLLVSGPEGSVEGLPARNGSAEVVFARPGRYALQIVADTAQGPLPFATWHVEVAGGAGPRTQGVEQPADARRVLAAINRARAQMAVPALRPDPLLAALAQERAEQLALRGEVAHALGVGDSPVERFERAHIAADRIAENVARAPSLGEAHAHLDASPSHRANRIDPALDSVGIGIAARDGNVYLIEIFAAHPRISDR